MTIRMSMRRTLPLLLSVVYFFAIKVSIGVRWDHIVILGILLLGYYAHWRSRQLITVLFPFALVGIVYDMLRLIPPDFFGKVWIQEPYEWERRLFGIHQGANLLLPHQWLRRFVSLPLDLYCGFIYSLHVVIPVLLTTYLALKRNQYAKPYAYAFLAINLMSFVTYVVFPVAPPWYLELYGYIYQPRILGNAAGLVSVDQWLKTPYFQNLYSKSSWIFGAIPSMHAGFPVLTLLFVRKIWPKNIKNQLPFLFFMLSAWFAAIYLQQHYAIDIVAGIIYAVATFIAVSFLFNP